MKIILDNIIFSLQRSGGISVVWYEMIFRLLNFEAEIDIHFIEHMNARNNIFRSKLNIKSKSIISYKNVLLFFRRYFNPQIEKQNNKFIFHSSYYRIANNKNAINITTVHDFTYERYKHGIKKSIHSFQKFNAIRKSDFVICVSENTKKDLFHYLPEIDKKKVYVIHNGVSDEYFPNQPETKFEPYFKKNEYLLFVGKRDKYKRFDLAVETAELLQKKLIIIGGGKLSKKEINYLNSKLEKKDYYQYIGINNCHLNILYNKALCLLYPSEYEGFGIPILEAQKAGCPVVAYNSGATKEVAGNYPLLFNNLNAYFIVKLIKENLYNEILKEKIILIGIENANKYTWDAMFNKTLELYRLAYSTKR